MNQEPDLIRRRMRTPRAAAIAGIVFSLLFITSLLLADSLRNQRDELVT
jgi:hypothetical protein